MSVFYRMFEHLLPRGRAWILSTRKQIGQFFAGLAEGFGPSVKLFYDELFLDIFPGTTRQLAEWEQQFGVISGGLTEVARRERLTAEWQALGGQDPRYIQDVLQAAGFDVYVHDFFEPRPNYDDPIVVRNPFTYVNNSTEPGTSCGEALMEAGEEFAQCGNYLTNDGYPLVNKTPTLQVVTMPADTDTFSGYMYIGAEVFGTFATVSASQRNDFERLILKICPAHLWVGVLVEYV